VPKIQMNIDDILQKFDAANTRIVQLLSKQRQQ